MDLNLLLSAFLRMLAGIPVALQLVGLSVGIGFILATGVASARIAKRRWVRWPAFAYVYTMRGTPLILQLFFVYYGFGQFAAVRHSWVWPFLREAEVCAVLALSLSTAAYGSEIIRGGLQSVSGGMRDAADAMGFTRWQRFRLVVFPLAVRQMLPAYGNELVLMMKATSVASTITIMEITGIARTIASETYRPVEVFMAAGLIYLGLTASLTGAVRLLEARLRLIG